MTWYSVQLNTYSQLYKENCEAGKSRFQNNRFLFGSCNFPTAFSRMFIYLKPSTLWTDYESKKIFERN